MPAVVSSDTERTSACLAQCFDAVIMLCWSDSKAGPRHNQFHFARLFAEQLPVLLVQQMPAPEAPLEVESSGFPNIDIVKTGSSLDEIQANDVRLLLRSRGIKRPLLWIYDSQHYQSLIDALPNAFRVYHATKDYLTSAPDCILSTADLSDSISALLPQIDLLVGVSQGIIESYQRNGHYGGAVVLAETACDSEFFFNICDNADNTEPRAEQVALYQGRIDKRLDFDLLNELVSSLPNWTFWFCGSEDLSAQGWKVLKCQPNVSYLGVLTLEQLADRMRGATIGLIPFKQCAVIETCLPQKAFEYLSCALPVVTVPITVLQRYPDLFTSAGTSRDFVEALQRPSLTIAHQALHLRNRQIANEHSYAEGFNIICCSILQEWERMQNRPRKLNVAVFFDEGSMHIATISDHLLAFRRYLNHQVFFVPATISSSRANEVGRHTDLSMFDVVILHYAVRISLPDYINGDLAQKLARFGGLKMLFIQDEYETTETARQWMEKLQFDVIYTLVPEEGRETIFPKRRFPTTEFLSTRTGYVPEDHSIEHYAMPLEQRKIVIGYRGRILPFYYGALGQEKYQIGVEVKRLAEEHGIPVDIEVDDYKRIYGTDWYRFLGSVRATIGTESGANVFDFDGKLKEAVTQAVTENPKRTFDDIHREFLAEHEGLVKMNQISPKIFEAIRLRTALVLFEGEYSGVIKPNLHYIPLAKDYSNIDEVFKKLDDLDYLRELTERAYSDVIGCGKDTYEQFIVGVGDDIAARTLRMSRRELFKFPLDAHGPDRINTAIEAPLAAIDSDSSIAIAVEPPPELLPDPVPDLPWESPPASPPVAPLLQQRLVERFPRLYATTRSLYLSLRWIYHRALNLRARMH